NLVAGHKGVVRGFGQDFACPTPPDRSPPPGQGIWWAWNGGARSASEGHRAALPRWRFGLSVRSQNEKEILALIQTTVSEAGIANCPTRDFGFASQSLFR